MIIVLLETTQQFGNWSLHCHRWIVMGWALKKSIHGPIPSLESRSRAEPKPRPFTKLCSITYLSRLLRKQHTTSLAKLLMIKLSFKKWKMLIISIELKIVLSNDWTLFKHEFLGASRSYFFPPSSLPYPPWNYLILGPQGLLGGL